MEYYREIRLKNGEECLLKNAEESDAAEVMRCFLLTHGETDFLSTYPEETPFTLEGERSFIRRKAESEKALEVCAFQSGKVIGTAGISPIGAHEKTRHRACVGVSVERAHWGKGVGRALMSACIECARRAGYLQLELEVVGENQSALALYESLGFTAFGRNPKGFRLRDGRWQELVGMRLEL